MTELSFILIIHCSPEGPSCCNAGSVCVDNEICYWTGMSDFRASLKSGLLSISEEMGKVLNKDGNLLIVL